MTPLVLAVGSAVSLSVIGFIWKRFGLWGVFVRARRRLWYKAHELQWKAHQLEVAEIADLRRNVNGCLKILDHMSTGGTGDWSQQWRYAQSVLDELGQSGICSRDEN